ncbi:MAG TPA: CoA-binding protein [Flavobacteriales bacterium]|nr:CoA-binding protein [Flavobacteriales bacterium]
MTDRTTLVLGASPEPSRYANIAARRLMGHGHPVLLVGKHKGTIGDAPIVPQVPAGALVDTVTLYLAPRNQADVMPDVLALRPRRIIFNPGTENPAFARAAEEAGIEVIEACTLVMLATDQY